MKFGPELRADFSQKGVASSVVQLEKMEAPLMEDNDREVCEKEVQTGGSLEAIFQGTEEGDGGGFVGGPMELYKSQTVGKLCTLGNAEQVKDPNSPPKRKDLACCNEGKDLLEKDLVVTGGMDSCGLNDGLAQSYYMEEPPGSPSQLLSSSPSS